MPVIVLVAQFRQYILSFMKETPTDRTQVSLLIYLFILIALVIILRNAWVCDDAYISFRTVDNFVNGYGLTWNVVERVQSFTNPLWVLFVSVFYLFTKELYYTSIALSILLTISSMFIISFKVSKSTIGSIFVISLIICSKAFIDYTTSGLETPLNYLILSAFYFVFIKYDISNKTFLVLSLLAALGTLNRMDTILLYIPVLIYLFFKLRSIRTLWLGLLGFAPFIMWEIFSIIYYGFPFPNTYYAKLHSGIPLNERLVQGLLYYLDSLNIDPITLIVILAGIGIVFLKKDRRNIPFALGIMLYLLYIVRIGGDFMSGRFFALPFLGSLLIISRMSFGDNWVGKVTPFAIILLMIGISPRSPLFSDNKYGLNGEGGINPKGIADERGWYFQSTGLLNADRTKQMPNHKWVDDGKRIRLEKKTYAAVSCVGFTGYFAGPDVHICDGYALTDPLLARLPTCNQRNWRIGHFSRYSPWGYTQSLKDNKNLIADSSLKVYYDKLLLITRGELFDFKRWETIWNMNMGGYDSLLNDYTHPPMLSANYSAISSPKPEGMAWDNESNYIIRPSGIRIVLDSVCFNKQFEISVDHNDYYWVAFYLDSLELGGQAIKRQNNKLGGLRVDILDVPPDAILAGYNNIYVYPERGDDLFSIGHLKLHKDPK